MKRIAVLLVVLLMGLSLYGCGANGTTGTTSSSSGNNGSTTGGTGTPSGPVTAFTLKLVDNAARTVSFGTGTTATDARVVIRRFDTVPSYVTPCIQPSYDSEGNPAGCLVFGPTTTVYTYTEVWKDIQDVKSKGTGTISVGIPVGNAYTLDVITALFSGASGSYDILSYGTTSNVDVSGNGSTTIVMQPVPVLLDMTVTDPAVTKGKFVVTLNNKLPFNPAYQLTMNYNGITEVNSGPTHTVETITTSSNRTTIDLPASYTANKQIDVSANLTLNSAFLKTGEATTKWKRTFPDGAYGENAFGIFVPFSQVTITLP